MLYVFQVDTGTTIMFDIKLALQSVAHLKEAIERECNVAAAHQVLLMSGGESLESNARVCSYSAGTDTNPIYLFNKAAIESQIPPAPSIDHGSDVDLQNQIDASLAMPATYQTLVARAQLAQQCCGLAREQTRICEKLVHDQHLQQQGWSAVVANLEDITQLFRSRADLLQQSFALYLAERHQYVNLLDSFNADLGILAKIPILPALRAHAEGLMSSDEEPESMEKEPENEDVLSLLRWISAKDNQSCLEQVADQCSRGIEQFDEKVMETLKAEVNAAIESANKQDMKEVKGLGDRLFTLEQLMVQTKKLVLEQGELAQGFLQNQNRANNLGDASVLPDLCTSHRRQLIVMLQNHNQLRDIRRRCIRAKEELSANIYHRLKWIMYVENKMMEVDGRLIMYNESLKRLRRHLEVLQQIHLAPQMYISAVTEVVRRRTFSQAFLVWASNLACQLLTVHTEEIARRREFQTKFEGHFLNSLFPGLEDTPPPFATDAPSVFDSELPKLTLNDMESLKAQLPDLSLLISTPDLNSITQFFLSKSLTEGSTDDNKDKDNVSMRVDVPSKEQEHITVPTSAERADFESETDTEEFEKIGQGTGDSKPTSFDGEGKQKLQKEMEENLGQTREELERLRSVLRTMKTVLYEAMASFREELVFIRDRSTLNNTELTNMTDRIHEALSLYSCECDRRMQEREQELTVDHELELGDMKKQMQNQVEEIRTIKQTLVDKETELIEHEHLITTMRQKLNIEQTERRNLQSHLDRRLEETLEQARIDKETAVKKINDEKYMELTSFTNSLTQCQERIQELEASLAAAQTEQQRMIKEVTDKLQIQHKTELETIRSRFKLMAASNMERSPSDSSLEKIERLDIIELANHEAIVSQVKEDMKLEKCAAVRTAIERERNDYLTKLDFELKLARQIVEKKDMEIGMYKRREAVLSKECARYKNTIRRLTKSENVGRQNLNEKVLQTLEADKSWLECQISGERSVHEKDNFPHLEATLRKELEKERLQISQSDLELALKNLESDKDEIEVSESKKVRLDANDDSTWLSRRIDLLENDNKKLLAELQLIRECKEVAEAKVESLEADKIRLQMLFVSEQVQKAFTSEPSTSSAECREKEMTASVSVVSDLASQDSSISPELHRRPSSSVVCFKSFENIRRKMIKYAMKLAQHGRITISSCNPGDIVLVVWDPIHWNYSLFQESTTRFFLNSDCVGMLGLNSDGTPKRMQAIAEVIDKEYCQARKPKNRYHIPVGTKFYRVRVKSVEDDGAALLTESQQQ